MDVCRAAPMWSHTTPRYKQRLQQPIDVKRLKKKNREEKFDESQNCSSEVVMVTDRVYILGKDVNIQETILIGRKISIDDVIKSERFPEPTPLR